MAESELIVSCISTLEKICSEREVYHVYGKKMRTKCMPLSLSVSPPPSLSPLPSSFLRSPESLNYSYEYVLT